ncbi:hypothetical protein D030_2678 [Vibrio parahaemolyticus AQ3810]|nr:hypothetical protein D030_2678 [Vibrio parahaemolyticus AQ3810]
MVIERLYHLATVRLETDTSPRYHIFLIVVAHFVIDKFKMTDLIQL